jgi:uncharacterized protein YceK
MGLFLGLQHLRQRQILRPRRHQQTLQRRRRTQTASLMGLSGAAGRALPTVRGVDSAAMGIKANPVVAIATLPARILKISRRCKSVIGVLPTKMILSLCSAVVRHVNCSSSGCEVQRANARCLHKQETAAVGRCHPHQDCPTLGRHEGFRRRDSCFPNIRGIKVGTLRFGRHK